MRNVPVALALSLIIVLPSAAQTRATPAEPSTSTPKSVTSQPATGPQPGAQSFIPTRFRAAVNGSTLELSWEAPSDPPGGWGLYRSSQAFSSKTMAQAEILGKYPGAQRSLRYSPTDAKAWFYALLPFDGSGVVQQQFMPGKTVTAIALSVTPEVAKPAAPPPTPIGDLAASGSPTALTLSFSIQKGTGDVLMYRSLSPFSDATSLLAASLIATLPDTTKSFLDYPIPGSSYYYALVKESDLKSGTLSFGPGGAATIGPVGIAAPPGSPALPETGDLARSYPLPYWLFAKPGDPGIGEDRARISSQTEKAIASILSPFPASKPRPPVLTVLQEDKGQARGGEEYALSLIIQGSLRSADWRTAISQLQGYLSLNRSPAIASRAHFYLGEAFAMTGSYRDAFFEFLLARDFNAPATRPWLLWLVAMERS